MTKKQGEVELPCRGNESANQKGNGQAELQVMSHRSATSEDSSVSQTGPTPPEDRERASEERERASDLEEREMHTDTPLASTASTLAMGGHTFHSDHEEEVTVQEVAVQEVAVQEVAVQEVEVQEVAVQEVAVQEVTVIMERNPAYVPIGTRQKKMKSDVDVQYDIPQMRCSDHEVDHFPDIQMQANPAYCPMRKSTIPSHLLLKDSNTHWPGEGILTSHPEDSPSEHVRLQTNPSYIQGVCTEGTLQLQMEQNLAATGEISQTCTEELSASTADSSSSTRRATDEETDYDYVLADMVVLHPVQLPITIASYKLNSTAPTAEGAQSDATEAPPTSGDSSEVVVPLYI